MPASKKHYAKTGNGTGVCGRTPSNARNATNNVFAVDCRRCQAQSEFIDAMAKAAADKMEAFLTQEPRKVREPWKDGDMTCGECGGDLFRHADRTCYGHYDNWVCAGCGHNESRLTETGMSF